MDFIMVGTSNIIVVGTLNLIVGRTPNPQGSARWGGDSTGGSLSPRRVLRCHKEVAQADVTWVCLSFTYCNIGPWCEETQEWKLIPAARPARVLLGTGWVGTPSCPHCHHQPLATRWPRPISPLQHSPGLHRVSVPQFPCCKPSLGGWRGQAGAEGTLVSPRELISPSRAGGRG